MNCVAVGRVVVSVSGCVLLPPYRRSHPRTLPQIAPLASLFTIQSRSLRLLGSVYIVAAWTLPLAEPYNTSFPTFLS